jgi:PAS domain S-box-containing protein
MPEASRNSRLVVSVDIADAGWSVKVAKAICEGCAGQWYAEDLAGNVSGTPMQADCVLIVRREGEDRAIQGARIGAFGNIPRIVAVETADAAKQSLCLYEQGADYLLPYSDLKDLMEGAVRLLRHLYARVRAQSPEFRTKLPFAVAITDKAGRVLFWNDVAEQVFGHRSVEVLGRTASEVMGADMKFVDDLLARDDMSGQGELCVRRPDATELILQWRARARPGNEGVTIVFDDITGRVQVENELREAIRAADAAFRAKSEFLAVISHEIRTPMNSIIGFTELLLDTPVDKRQRDYMEIVRANGITLLELINNVLEFSRIESGKVEVTLAPVDLAELTASVIDSMWVEASRKGIELFSRIQDDVPQKVLAVELELRRILTNLVANGVKFTEHGSVQVFIQVTQDGGRPYLLFSVVDTGIGIDESKINLLFKSFSQVDSSSTRRFGGTGLGLAISRKLCESMGGRMWVKSEAGKGSTFFFTIPLLTPDRSEPARVSDKGEAPQPPAIPSRPLSILVADDEPMNRLLVKRFLSKLGQNCDLAENGKEVVEKLRENNYDIVLMDVQMPEMDGIHAAKEVRNGNCGEDRKGVYICALTAYAMAGDQEKCIDAGMNDYLSKPLTLPSLRRAIEKASLQLAHLPSRN